MRKKSLCQIIIFAIISILFITPTGYTAEKKIVIFPFSYTGDPSKAYIVQTIKRMLGARLSGDGLEVIDPERYYEILNLNEQEKSGNISKNKIMEYVRKLKSSYAIYGNVATVGTTSSLDFSILNIGDKTGKPIAISETASEDQLIVKIANISLQVKEIIQGRKISSKKDELKAEKTKAQPSVEKLLSSLKITDSLSMRNTLVMAFDIADLNQDGNSEWLILEQQIIKIFVNENGKMIQKDSLKTSFGETFFKISAGDVDGNGIPEIYVISLYGAIMRTSVWEWRDKFHKLFTVAGNVRVIKGNDFQKPVLLFQDSVGRNLLYGIIYVMQYDKSGKLNQKEPLKHLNNVQFSTLTIVDLDEDGEMEYLGLDNNSNLCVWDTKGECRWKSRDEMGGTSNIIRPIEESDQSGANNITFALNSRLVVMDIDRDGKNEIISIKNIPSLSILDNWKTYTKCNIYAFKIDGKKLVPCWTSEEIPYCTTDIQSDGWTLFATGHESRVISVFKGASYIFWFE